MRTSGWVGDIVRGASYGALISTCIGFKTLVPKPHPGHYVLQVLVFVAVLGFPLLWRDLYAQPKWLNPLARRLTVGWIVVVAFLAAVAGANGQLTFGPASWPGATLVGIFIGCIGVGLVASTLVAGAIAVLRNRRAQSTVQSPAA